MQLKIRCSLIRYKLGHVVETNVDNFAKKICNIKTIDTRYLTKKGAVTQKLMKLEKNY